MRTNIVTEIEATVKLVVIEPYSQDKTYLVDGETVFWGGIPKTYHCTCDDYDPDTTLCRHTIAAYTHWLNDGIEIDF